MGGNEYYRLTGYVTEPLWVRFGDYGALYYRDEQNERDVLLTSFERTATGKFFAPFRVCGDTLGQGQDGSGKHNGPTGPIESTLVIHYSVISCADAGLLEEQYAQNIGMVERIEQSFAGPRVYDLVAARVGASTIQAGSGTNFGVTLRKPDSGSGLLAILDLRVYGPDSVTLHYRSSQQYDASIRNEQGVSIWSWSANKLFLQVLMDEITHGRSWTIPVPLTDYGGQTFPPGKYTLDAWLVTGSDRPQFAGSAPFQIPEKE